MIFPSRDDRDITRLVLTTLDLSDLRPVKPDFLIGLARQKIRIAKDSSSPPLRVSLEIFLMARPQIIYEINGNRKSA